MTKISGITKMGEGKGLAKDGIDTCIEGIGGA